MVQENMGQKWKQKIKIDPFSVDSVNFTSAPLYQTHSKPIPSRLDPKKRNMWFLNWNAEFKWIAREATVQQWTNNDLKIVHRTNHWRRLV